MVRKQGDGMAIDRVLRYMDASGKKDSISELVDHTFGDGLGHAWLFWKPNKCWKSVRVNTMVNMRNGIYKATHKRSSQAREMLNIYLFK